MELSEKELENHIFNDLIENGGSNLNERGLSLPFFQLDVNPKWYKQLNIDPYGIIDIAGFYRYAGQIRVDLLELKKVSVDANHIEQIFRYRKGLEVYLANTFKGNISIRVNCIIIGSSNDGLYTQNYSPVDIASYEIDLINGINFEYTHYASGWHIKTNEKKSFRKPKTNGQKVY